MPMVDMPLGQLRQYTGRAPRPADFDEYWEKALREVHGVCPETVQTPAAFSPVGADCFDVYFTGVRGARIHAKFLRPQTPGPHPCVLCFHGYTCSSGDWSAYLPYLVQGMCVAAMDCRGQAGDSEDTGGVTGNTQHGHIIRGLQDGAEELLFRHIFLDTVQLVRVVSAMPEVDPQRIAVSGASQGGALAVACSALNPQIRRAVIQMPFLSDFKRVWEMDMTSNAYMELFSYFRMFDPCHEKEAAIFETLGHIDVRFLAPRIKAEVLMATGLMDKTCPTSTHFAVYNALTCAKQLVIYPDFGHEPLPGFSDREQMFLKGL